MVRAARDLLGHRLLASILAACFALMMPVFFADGLAREAAVS
ncbi:MAG: hypothetical protein PHS73_02415 [Candidatus Peribacteraceae bacterium]|nr:hypothetical protein [Candidatus Peribacteraceae bacterium]